MKIAIIGAGPGGLYAALAAARRNIQVELFEKRNVGEGICCGECIFDSLKVMPAPGRGLLRPVDEMVLQGREPYPFPLSRHRPLWMLDRRTWQQSLASRARERGVVIHENAGVTGDRLARMQKEYDWIIDASGAPSVTSRLYRFADDYFREYLLAHQVVLAGDFSALMPRIKIGFFPNVPSEYQPAYYWVFPKDAGKANVGVVCTARGPLSRDQLDLKKLLGDILGAEGLADAAVLARGGGIGAVRMLPGLVYDNILLTGDAAGLTSALHGGGIDMACLSGVLAVEAVSGGRGGVARYAGKLKQYMKEKNALESVAIRKMRTLSFEQYDRLLRGVTAPGRITRLKTALGHLDMLYATLKWFGTKKEVPDWPV
ncbi:MAG: NAD(P)/FAD-dependent oxidoreductase [Deltaproteobacteria bacterium]